MINVTPKAKDELRDMLNQAGVENEEVGIRLAPTQTDGGQVQLGLVLDQPQDGDQVVEHDGRKVLVVDQFVADQLEGSTLDVVDTDDGPRLRIYR